jgi:hypothetical protein
MARHLERRTANRRVDYICVSDSIRQSLTENTNDAISVVPLTARDVTLPLARAALGERGQVRTNGAERDERVSDAPPRSALVSAATSMADANSMGEIE